MRGLLIIVLVIALMVLGGWLVFNISGSSASVEIRTDKIKEDSAEVVENAKEAINKASNKIEEKTDL